jgi:hypothetical protein
MISERISQLGEPDMMKAWVALGALVLSASAAAQLGPVSSEPQAGMTAPAKGGASESIGPGAAAWAKRLNAQGQMPEQDYIDELSRQLASAQRLVGAPLTEKDRGRIRSAVSKDLIAWRKQYDPRRKDYSAMRAKWLVDEDKLSPEGWAKQRVDWLRAQQEWILAQHRG